MSRPPEPSASSSSSAAPSLQELRAQRGRRPSLWRRFRAWFIAGGVLAALVLFGFLGLPPIVKAQATKRLSETLGREVSIGRVRINPLVLSATVEDFAIAESAPTSAPASPSENFAGWRRLHVNLDSWSLLAGEIGFQEIALDGFHARVSKSAEGGMNFDDIVARLAASDSDTEATSDAADASAAGPSEAPPPRPLAIARLTVTDAEIDFADASHASPFATRVGPLTFTLSNFRTVGDPNSPYNFEAVTAAGERFAWKGTVSADPAKSQGELLLANIDLARLSPYYHHLLAGELRSAVADLAGRYTFELRDGEPVVTFDGGEFTLRELRFGAPGVEADALALRRLHISGITADSLARRADLGRVSLEGLRVRAERDAAGAIDLARLFAPASPAGSAPAAQPATVPASAAPTAAAAPAPRLTVGEFAIADARLSLLDRSAPRPIEHRVESLAFTLRELDSGALEKPLPLSLDLSLPDEGRLVVTGSLAPQPLAGELAFELAKISLTPLAPYLESAIYARLAGGTLRGRGRVVLAEGGAAELTGEVGLAGLHTVDGKLGRDFVKWTDLAVSGLRFSSAPLAVHADLVRWVDPAAQLRIEADGTLSIAQAGTGGDGSPTASASSAASAPPVRRPQDLPATKPTSGPLTGDVVPKSAMPLGLALTVDRFELENAALRFEDRSIRPAARASLVGLSGNVSGLSTESLGRADVDLRGRVDGVAPVAVTGKLNPLGTPAFVDLKIDTNGIDLQPGAGPYIARFAGRDLAGGNLSLVITARLEERRVDMDTLVTLDRFHLGRENGSPDGTKLPLGLALALLRDPRGRIVLDVPVEGSLDDPKFRIGRVVLNVLTNTIAKAAASPFSLLGQAFGGGGDELGWQEFAFGSAAPDADGIRKLETVARALNGRPALSLTITGGADPAADAAALRRERFEAELRAAAWGLRRLDDPNVPPPAAIEVTAEERPVLLARLHAMAFPEPTPASLAPAPAEASAAVAPTSSPVSSASSAASAQEDPDSRRTPGRLPRFGGTSVRGVVPAPAVPDERARPAPAVETPPAAQAAPAPTVPVEAPPAFTPEEMESRLLARIRIPEADIRGLAEERAQNLRAWLIERGKVAPERITLAPPRAGAARAEFELK